MLSSCESEKALEALDGYLETLEMIRRQPRVDKWKVSRVSQFLFNQRLTQHTIKKFSENAIDGYALLVLEKDAMQELTKEPERVQQEIDRLKKLWIKVLSQRKTLAEYEDIFEELNMKIDPAAKEADAKSNAGQRQI